MQRYNSSYFNEETKIGQGADGIVYSLEKNKVVKFVRQSRYAKKEKTINQILSENKIYVPKIHEIIEIRFPKEHSLHNNGNRQWGIVMERLEGKYLFELNNDEENLADNLYSAKLEKILDLSLYPQDTGKYNNTMYIQESDDLAFFDFTKWKTAKMSKKMKKEILFSDYCPYRKSQEGLRY
jgi:hypothetical protein